MAVSTDELFRKKGRQIVNICTSYEELLITPDISLPTVYIDRQHIQREITRRKDSAGLK
jgi:hypothetical protein